MTPITSGDILAILETFSARLLPLELLPQPEPRRLQICDEEIHQQNPSGKTRPDPARKYGTHNQANRNDIPSQEEQRHQPTIVRATPICSQPHSLDALQVDFWQLSFLDQAQYPLSRLNCR